MTTPVQPQLDDLARRVGALELELAALRPVPAPAPAPTPTPAPEPAVWPPYPPPAPVPPRAAESREPWIELPKVEVSDLFGAKALAIAGGVVTLLGIVFCFVLAVDRGWVGPAARVGIAGAASAILVLAGIELHRRFATTHSALAAVGAGIAGAYATLLAATSLYHLLPDGAALIIAAAIAAAAVAIALGWKAQLVAGFGLVGALLAPVALATQDGLTTVGIAFAALVLAATGIVALRQRWRGLLVAAFAVSLPQIAALVLHSGYHGQAPLEIVILAAVFAALYLAAGIAWQLRFGGRGLERLSSSLVFAAAILATGAGYRLFGTEEAQGAAVLAVALVYGALAAAFMVRRARDLGALLAAVAFTAGALGLVSMLSGDPLAFAWAAQGAALAWLAHRTKEIRFQLWSALYLLLAAGHALALDAPFARLWSESAHPAAGVPALLALAAALVIFVHEAGGWPEPEPGKGLLARLDLDLAAAQGGLRASAAWVVGVALAYAAALGALELLGFGPGHGAVAAIWGGAGVALLIASRTRRVLYAPGSVAVCFAAGFVFVHSPELATTPRAWSFAVASVVLLAGAVAFDRIPTWTLGFVGPVWAILSAAFAVVASMELVSVSDSRGYGLLALAAVYSGLSAVLRRRGEQPNLSTVLWAIAALLGAVAAPLLLSGTALVVAWSAAAVALAWLSVRIGERRLLVAVAGYSGLALVYALAILAPPSHLFVLGADRGGAAAVLVIAAAVAAIAWMRSELARAFWLAGALGVYGISIAILELTAGAYPAGSEAAFHTGHTLVSAFWGLLALALLYAGLTRWRGLRLAGLALFAAGLAKLFLFDLGSLSSITRALSFLAVGAVLLVGGFFYQRLASTREGVA